MSDQPADVQTEQIQPEHNEPIEQNVEEEDQGDYQESDSPVKTILKVDLAQMMAANAEVDSSSSPEKFNLMEELASREDEIRRMLYETKDVQNKDLSLSDKKKKKSTYEISKAVANSDDEECTFQPKINPKTTKLLNRPSTEKGISGVSERLYQEEFERKDKAKENEAERKQNASRTANSNKINSISMKIVLKKIEAALRHLISEVEGVEQKGKLNFENVGDVLQRLGVFQGLEFHHTDEGVNRSSLAVTQSKVKPQRLAQEIALHENLWKILTTTSEDENSVSSEILFRFLMVLVEDKASIADSASFLQMVLDVGLEAKGLSKKEGEDSIFEAIKQEKNLWDLKTLITEFRRLFNDKTAFMNIYSTIGVVQNRPTASDKNTTDFKPQINPKSKEILQKSTRESYKDKIISKNPETSPTKLSNRYDILFEHRKYLDVKRNEDLEAKLEKELANCTFKPQIKSYKNPNAKDQVEGLPKYSQGVYTPQDIAKAKRHDLLYDVAKVQKDRMNQKAYEHKKHEEDKELAECTFQPKKYSRPETSSKIEQSVVSSAPKGYQKAVERMQVAEKLREERRLEKERVSRGEKYEQLKNADFKPPSFLQRPKIKKQEALVYVDVNIGPGKTGRIGIHQGDDATTLARNFAKTYSLPSVMKDSLEKLLQSYIDSYFPEKDPNQELEEEGYDQEGIHEEQENIEDHDDNNGNENRGPIQDEEELEDNEEELHQPPTTNVPEEKQPIKQESSAQPKSKVGQTSSNKPSGKDLKGSNKKK